MNRKNKVFPSSVIVLFLAIAMYLAGCASAEINSGKIAFQEKNYEKAAVELKKGLAKDSSDAEAWYMLGVSLIETKNYQEGGRALKKSLSLSNAHGDNIFNYYVTTFNAGVNRFNGAISQYKTDSAGGMNSFRDAADIFVATTTIFPDSIGSMQMLADTYTILGKKQEALIIYENILEKSKSPQDAKMIARILRESGSRQYDAADYDGAIETFTQVINLKYLPTDDENLLTSRLLKAYSDYKIAEKIAIESGVNAEATEHLNNAVAEAEILVTMTQEKNTLADAYQLLVNAYDALGNDAKKAEAETKLQQYQ